MQALRDCFTIIRQHVEPQAKVFPRESDLIWTWYEAREDPTGIQKDISARIVEKLASQDLDRVQGKTKARLISLRVKGASKWLEVIPSDRELQLSDMEFSMAASLRMGVSPVPPASLPRLCECNRELTNDPNHFAGCGALKKRTMNTRHDFVLKSILRSSSRYFAAVMSEPPADFETRERLDGLILLPGAALAIDVTITHPETHSNQRRAMSPLGAAKYAERLKIEQYEAKAEAMGMEFFPVAFETHGAMGPLAREFFRRMGELLDREAYAGMSVQQAMDIVKADAAIALQRGNVRVIIQGLQRERSRRIATLRRQSRQLQAPERAG